jgi:hypothetical protein
MMTKMVAVTTLRDAAGADVAKEMLAERGIPAEIRRLGMNAYLGAATAEEFEVRVPPEWADDARAALDAMAEELERAALAEAGVPPGEGDARGGDDLPPPELRPRKLSWAVALGFVGPLPGCGLLYARAFKIGWTFVGASLALMVAGFVASNADALVLVLALKAADVLLAPFCAAAFNRKLAKASHAAVA